MIMFNEHDEMTEDFNFKIGMKFSSLKKFKNDILEHNVLNLRCFVNARSIVATLCCATGL